MFNSKLSRRQIVSRFLALLAILAVFTAGALTGVSFEQRRQGLDLGKFWHVFNLIKKNYVGDINNDQLVEGAVKGLVEGVGDPYSSYLPPSERQSLEDELKGEFEGIGAELTEKDQLITVVTPIADSPAEKAGLKAKDIITKIDDTSTEGMSVNDAVTKIRGPKGSVVKLTVLRGSDLKEINITRATIVVKSVSSKMLGEIAYIEINQFGDDTVDLAEAAVKELADKSPKAVILDLRNNPGGYLNSVTPIAGLFLPPSTIVKEKYRDGKSDELRSTNLPLMPDTPLYVLVNSGSASAAEILAGAFQDYKRATLIGEKTFGKGSVQDVIDLSGRSALRITIAEWLTPNGRAINKVGITPDVEVKDEKTDSTDPVLDKALELAKK